MKLYIENCAIQNVSFEKISKMENVFTQHKQLIEIYSENGNFIIQNNQLYKTTIEEEMNIKHIKNYYNKFNLLIDNSCVEKQEYYCFPQNHIVLNLCESTYSLNKKSLLKLVVLFKHVDNLSLIGGTINSIKQPSNNHSSTHVPTNKYTHYSPIDFYFTLPNNVDINTSEIKEEINKFMLVLMT
jgi:hypothetical protein